MKKINPQLLYEKYAQLLRDDIGSPVYWNDVPYAEPDKDIVTFIPLDGLPGDRVELPFNIYNSLKREQGAPVIIKRGNRQYIEEPPPEEELENNDEKIPDNISGKEKEELSSLYNDEEKTKNDEVKRNENIFNGKDESNEDEFDEIEIYDEIEDKEDLDEQKEDLKNEEPEEGSDEMDTDPSMAGGDPNAMGGMGGMGMDAPKTANEIGKIFELKKIYSRLLAIEEYLSFSSDEFLLKLRKFVGQSIDLFEILSANIDSFKDQIDDIIIIYYKFLSEVYSLIKRYYKIKKQKNKEDKSNKKSFKKIEQNNNTNNSSEYTGGTFASGIDNMMRA